MTPQLEGGETTSAQAATYWEEDPVGQRVHDRSGAEDTRVEVTIPFVRHDQRRAGNPAGQLMDDRSSVVDTRAKGALGGGTKPWRTSALVLQEIPSLSASTTGQGQRVHER